MALMSNNYVLIHLVIPDALKTMHPIRTVSCSFNMGYADPVSSNYPVVVA